MIAGAIREQGPWRKLRPGLLAAASILDYIRSVVFDLGKAMRKKEAFESERLMAFEFRRRARAARFFGAAHHLDENVVFSLVATLGDTALIERLAKLAGLTLDEAQRCHAECLQQAHDALVREYGDPAPHRLA